LLQSLRRETKQLTIDLFVMRAQGRTKPVRLPRCLTELWYNPRKTNDGALSRFDTDLVIFKHGTHAEMGIVHVVCRIIHWPCRNTGLDHGLHSLLKRLSRCPL